MSGIIPTLPEPKNTFGHRLKIVRVSQSLMSQEGFAKAFGMSFASYRLYEAGTREMPLRFAVKIWEVYDLDADWFFGRSGNNAGSAEQ